MSDALIQIDAMQFSWPDSGASLLQCQSFQLQRGQHLFIRGPSGSGKSTLLNLFAGVLTPDAGELRLLDQNTRQLGAAARDRLRADHIGYIFQQFNLVPYLDLVENVLLPCRFSAARNQRARAAFGTIERAANYLLDALFVEDRPLAHTPVSRLSVGQAQRVAAARALIGHPDIIIADEPTSSLDPETRERFVRLLFEQAAAASSTLVFVSHDAALAQGFEQIVDIGHFRAEPDT